MELDDKASQKTGFERFGLLSFLSQTKLREFVNYLSKGQIVGSRCLKCGDIRFPPRADCTKCMSDRFEWVTLSGNCTLLTYTVVESVPAAFKDVAPYVLAVAKLDESPRIFATVAKSVEPDTLRVGMRLRVKAVQLPNGQLSFELAAVT